MAGLRLRGTGAADLLIGGAEADSFTGLGGADTLLGNAGNDSFIFAHAAAFLAPGRVIDGGQDVDWIRFSEAVTLTDSAFAEVAGMEALLLGGVGTASLTLGPLAAAAFAQGIRIAAATGLNALIVEGAALGAATPLRMTGTTGADRLIGGAGDDIFTGLGGADLLRGGAGQDRFLLTGAEALRAATLEGGAGSDRLELATAVTLTDADFAQVSEMERIVLRGAGLSTLTLGTQASLAFADGLRITATAGATLSLDASGLAPAVKLVALGAAGEDVLTGGLGDDSLSGGAGDDRLTGGGGKDTLLGGDGDDVLVLTLDTAGGARDVLRGGAGADALLLNLEYEDYARAEVKAELARLQGFLSLVSPGQEAGRFISTPLQLDMSGVETVLVGRDGLALSLAQAVLPFAVRADSYATLQGIGLTVNASAGVLANDQGVGLSVQAGILTTRSGGSVTLRADGSFDYRPGASVTGTDRFTYAVTDLRGDIGAATATISVSVNHPPVITGPRSLTLAENAGLNQVIARVTASDGDADGLMGVGAQQRMLGGEGVFLWDSNSGELRLTGPLDFESRTSWTLTFEASDGRLVTTQALTVSITDVNDAPVLTGPAEVSLPEGTWFALGLGQLAGLDQDAGAVLRYSLVSPPAGFTVDPASGVLSFTGTLDFETTPSVTLQVRVSDGSLTDTRSLTVRVLDVNEPATLLPPAPDSLILLEHLPLGTVFGRLVARDPDAGQVVTFLPFDTALPFAINAVTGEMSVTGLLDYETRPGYDVVVRMLSSGQVSEDRITITLRDGNDPPVISGPSVSGLPERQYVNQVIETYTASDPNPGSTLAFSLDDGFGLFSINATTGVLSVNGLLDHETTAQFLLTVRVSDGALSSTQVLTLNVGNQDDPPVFLPDSPTAFTLSENAGINSFVGRILAMDPDVGAVPRFLPLAASEPFQIDPVTGIIRVVGPLDHGVKPVHDLAIQLRSEGETITSLVRITLLDETELLSGPRSVAIAENAVTVGPVADFGLANSLLNPARTSFTLLGDDGYFRIDAATGEIFQLAPLDYEVIPALQMVVQASDGANSQRQLFTVQVVDVAEPNRIIGLPGAVSLREDLATGSALFTFRLEDPKGAPQGGLPILRVEGFPASPELFTLRTTDVLLRTDANGQNFVATDVTVVLNQALDFETRQGFTLNFGRLGGADDTSIRSVSVSVSDVNEPPVLTLPFSGRLSILEGVYPVQATTGLIGTDPDANTTLTFSLVDDFDMFGIDPATGQLFYGGLFDFEAQSLYTLRIRVSDGTNVTERELPFHVDDRNEAPSFLGTPPVNLREDVASGTVIANVRLTDPDGPNATEIISTGVTGGNGRFTWNSLTGDVTLTGRLNYELQTQHILTFTASDGEFEATTILTINVLDVFEGPNLPPVDPVFG